MISVSSRSLRKLICFSVDVNDFNGGIMNVFSSAPHHCSLEGHVLINAVINVSRNVAKKPSKDCRFHYV